MGYLCAGEACELDSGGVDELGLCAVFLRVGAGAGHSPDAAGVLLGGGDGIDNAVGGGVEGKGGVVRSEAFEFAEADGIQLAYLGCLAAYSVTSVPPPKAGLMVLVTRSAPSVMVVR